MKRELAADDPEHPDFQKELGYAPCRDENCLREAVHPAHEVDNKKSGRLPRTCPRCLGKVDLSTRRAGFIRCFGCGWRRDLNRQDGP